METIYDATLRGTVIATLSDDAEFNNLGVAQEYSFSRPSGTLTTFAKGVPVAYINGKWTPVQVMGVIVEWHTKVKVLEVIPS